MLEHNAKVNSGPWHVARLLVVLPTWLGDTVMAGPVLRALRREYPDACMHVLGRPMMQELLRGAGWFDRFIPWQGRGVRRIGTWRLLRGERYDLAVLLPNSFISALVVFLAGARRRVGYARDARGWMLTDALAWKRGAADQVSVFLRLAEACGCDGSDRTLELPVSDEDRRAAAPFLDALASSPRVLLGPGSQWPSKRWPAERFAAAADALVEKYGASVGIVCGPGEEDLALAVAEAAGNEVTAFVDPVVPLGGMKAMLAGVDLFITNDSGPSHIAKAAGTPVVTLFGPVSPGHTATNLPCERAVHLDLPCSPCHKNACPLKHHRCMRDIASDEVVRLAGELLGKQEEERTA